MRLPRQVNGDELAHRLRVLGYTITRQTGSHLRVTTLKPGEYHVTIPLHRPLRVGTLAAILTEIAAFHSLTRDELVALLFT